MGDTWMIEEIDVHEGDEALLRSRWEAQWEVTGETEPEEPVVSFEQSLKELRNVRKDQKPRHLVAVDGGRVVGWASLFLEYTDSNRHLSWFDLGVRAGDRRRRVGTALLRQIAEMAAEDGRTIIGTGTVDGHAGDFFAEANGFEKKATERKSRLVLADLDRELMERWVAAADAVADEYDLIVQDDVCPDELLDPLVELYQVTNTAPRDDLEMEDEIMTAERWRDRESVFQRQGQTWWRLIARHRPTGQLAGFTEFWFSPENHDIAWQGWTAVDPRHRNHGIGRWLKAVNVLRLVDEAPQYAYVDTWNAFSNGPMLSINIAMGFELLRGYNEWQGKTEQVAAITKERLGS